MAITIGKRHGKVCAFALGRMDGDIVPLTAGQAGRTLGGGGWVMRRWIVVFALLGVVSSACAGDSGSAPSTEVMPTTSGSTLTRPEGVEPTSTAPPETPTTGIESAWPAVDVLVTNDDGVFLIDSTGHVTRLVTGRVAYAVDDTRGGLLFQVERGPLLDESSDTRVWWVPQGSGTAQELLVPTPGQPHDLSLYDAFRGEDSSIGVLYVRHDSPWDPDVGSFRFLDKLRTYTVESGAVNELVSWSGYEAGLGFASCPQDVVAVTFFDQVGSECGFFDPVSGDRLSIPGAPIPEPGCEADCPSGCIVAGEWLAFAEWHPESELVVALDLTGADQNRSFEFDRLVGALDLTDSYLLVNHKSEWQPFDDGPATVIDLRTGETWMVLLDGLARFVTSPVDLGDPAVPPTTAAIQLQADGLGVVDFGDPVEEAVAVLTAVLGSPDWNYDSEGTAVADRIVGWEKTLGLQFYPLHEGPPGPVLMFYSTGSPDFLTVEGIRVGSSAAELQDAYPDLRSGDGCAPDPAIPIVRVDRSSEESLFFYLDGDIADPQTRVVGIRGGYDLPSC